MRRPSPVYCVRTAARVARRIAARAWPVTTSDPQAAGGAVCAFEVTVTARSAIGTISGFDLEGYDRIDDYGVDAFGFFAETDYDSDTVEFTADPGALVDIELVLDSVVAPSYFVWYGNGAAQDGAPRSPVVFQPDMP